MSRFGDAVGAGVELNPDVPKPPFPLFLDVPSRWSYLDINPTTWQRSADRLIDQLFLGARLTAAERRTLLEMVEGLVADCQAAGAVLSLLTAGRRPEGGVATAGIHLAFGDDGQPASIGHVQDMIPPAGTRTELDGRLGPMLLQRERVTMLIPGTATLAALTSLQVFVPIPQTSWTAILATASAFPELTDGLESLVVTMAQSLQLGPDGVGDAQLDPDGADPGGADPSGGPDDPGVTGRATATPVVGPGSAGASTPAGTRERPGRSGPSIQSTFTDLTRWRLGFPPLPGRTGGAGGAGGVGEHGHADGGGDA